MLPLPPALPDRPRAASSSHRWCCSYRCCCCSLIGAGGGSGRASVCGAGTWGTSGEGGQDRELEAAGTFGRSGLLGLVATKTRRREGAKGENATGRRQGKSVSRAEGEGGEAGALWPRDIAAITPRFLRSYDAHHLRAQSDASEGL